jgi:hypothetical protein
MTQDTAIFSRRQGLLVRAMTLMHHESDDNEVTESSTSAHVSIADSSRRAVIHKTVVASTSILFYTTIACTKTSNPALAASSTIKPEDSYQGLLKAREELITAAKKYLANRDFDGMRTFLAEDALNINNYESNAQVSGLVFILLSMKMSL